MAARLNENLQVFHRDAEGSPGRGGDRQPPADAAREPDPPARRRHLYLAAARPARPAQSGGDRAPGDEPRRRDRALDARGAARRAVAGVGTLARVRPRAAAFSRPARTGPPGPPDPGT